MCSFPLGCIPDVSPKEKRIFLFDRQRSLNRRTGEKMGKSGPSYILNSSLAKSSCFLLLLILTSAWGQEFGIFNPMRSQITRFQVIFDNSLWAEGIPQQNIFSFLSTFGRLNFGWSLSLYHRTLLHIKRRLQHTLIFWSFLHNPYPNVQQAIVLKNSL